MSGSESHRHLRVPAELAGARLDYALDALVPELSRSRLQKMVRRGQVRLRGKLVTRSTLPVAKGDEIEIEMQATRSEAAPTLAVVHVDEHVVVVDKPAGMMAHATERHRTGSVAEQMAREYGPLPIAMGQDRPGIVHRLDRETSGLMVIARDEGAMEHLRNQFREREVAKTYLAVVCGTPREPRGTVDLPLIAVDSEGDRQRVARPGEGREARTRWELDTPLGEFSLLRCYPESGRRHQIRVHLTASGLPIVGDRLYGGPSAPVLPSGVDAPARHALHAHRLQFRHPGTERTVVFESPMPSDLAALVEGLRTA